MRPMGTTAYGGKGQGKGKGRGEGRLGQGGRGRSKGGEKPMGTTAYGGKGSKGRAANGDRPVGAASCRRDHHTMASCQPPPPPGLPGWVAILANWKVRSACKCLPALSGTMTMLLKEWEQSPPPPTSDLKARPQSFQQLLLQPSATPLSLNPAPPTPPPSCTAEGTAPTRKETTLS